MPAGKRPADALVEQGRTVHRWLAALPPEDFARPTVLPGWDVRTLTGHLILVHAGLTRLLGKPSAERPVPTYRVRPAVSARCGHDHRGNADRHRGPHRPAAGRPARGRAGRPRARPLRPGRPAAGDRHASRPRHRRRLHRHPDRRGRRPRRRPVPITRRSRTDHPAPRRVVPLHPYPGRDPGGSAAWPRRRGPDPPVRGRAVLDHPRWRHRPGTEAHPRHTAQRRRNGSGHVPSPGNRTDPWDDAVAAGTVSASGLRANLARPCHCSPEHSPSVENRAPPW